MRLKEVGACARQVIDGNTVAVVTDENVEKLYLQMCVRSFSEAGFDVHSFVIPAGEESKEGGMYLDLMNFLAEIPLTRSDAVAALGGGVIGDLAGFAAATYLRGVKVIQIPTTLLAAADSSIGGKTAINLSAGKNLAGAFHRPSLICFDPSLLNSLPADVYRDGMAEVIKYGVISDEALFQTLHEKGLIMRELSKDTLQDVRLSEATLSKIIKTCAGIKNRFVEEDEKDTGSRQLLNFGHTIGHAVEKASGYEISHGSAVAKGMAAMAHISEHQGWCSHQTCRRIKAILELYGFDITIMEQKRTLYDIMKADKKRKGGYIDIVTVEEIGRCRLRRLTIEEFGEIL